VSKGGHSHKGGDDYEPRPMKSIVDFEGKMIDAFTVTKVEDDNEFYDQESDTGFCYAFIVTAGWNRFEFKYKTIELRDNRRRKFKSKLLALGCVII